MTSSLFGLMDVDVASLTAARLAGTTISMEVGARAILLALATNAVVRVVYAAIAGSRAYAVPLGAATLGALVLGGTAAVILRT